ncbi:MAG TPA: hypothetical protein QF776_00140, partial [Acidimicrobiales bacterium]|nr:hypothetical protein [Acidimicrobiales bacterium]
MSSPETFLAYGAIMLIIALVGVAIDWFGKPLRHRKFIPKAYKFPDERHFRSEIFNSKPLTSAPSVVAPQRISEGQTSLTDGDSNQLTATTNEETSGSEIVVADSNDFSEAEKKIEESSGSIISVGKDIEPEERQNKLNLTENESSTQGQTGLLRLQGWSPGGYIYNLTQSGSEPSPSTVRSRFWKNVGVAPGSALFGSDNVTRLREGKPPQRRNPRTNKIETMKVLLLSYEEGKGITP